MSNRIRVSLTENEYNLIYRFLDSKNVQLARLFKKSRMRKSVPLGIDKIEEYQERMVAENLHLIKVTIEHLRADNKKINVTNIHRESKLSRNTIYQHIKKSNRGGIQLLDHASQTSLFE